MITFCLCFPLFNRLGKTIGKTITGLFREKEKKEEKKKEKEKKNHPYVTVLRTCSTNWRGGLWPYLDSDHSVHHN